ncbi:FixH family protein [Sporosarcina pasteurii]|uniref:YtkA-like domain-containing protein n=1 Tax=Sporosarcina pasteurii TaxID=1474 RepID=A0A380BBC3_SPOPA|nr:FixH family protein [Sporosarcina pasteurii]MDS9472925.1 FixH family protein [Sporosarcina pasteurii]QBQ06468.1 hypothetical protein E2C16_12675 [Sporosarcina pasteurii]SUI98410.1 Uncharacterised protein [Sporosarcina pasteurii]
MRRVLLLMIATIMILAGCGASKLDFIVEKAPVYEEEVASEFVLKVTDSAEEVTGLSIEATLEMAKMDHGVIEVFFNDSGDGTYTGNVELPMGGEWIADIRAEKDGKMIEDVLTFDVKER